MNAVRIRGLVAVVSGVALLAPIFGYLWTVDYGGVYMPQWVGPMLVGLGSPALWLVVRGAYAVVMGKPLPQLPSLRLRGR